VSPALSPLLVPVQLQALRANPFVRSQSFQRWTMNYSALAGYTSPEPAPFTGLDQTWAPNGANDGVYLQWTLPTALRQGEHDDTTGATSYPLVPNRWLIVRTWGPPAPSTPLQRLATAWVVESDYIGTGGTSAFLNPSAAAATPTLIGRVLPLAGWRETGVTTGTGFLTAVAPGNVAFAAYQPYSANVFSFQDKLANIASEGQSLSYFVAGWYSRPGDDILATARQGAGLPAALADLGWSVAGSETVNGTIFHGTLRGLAWSKTTVGPRPSTATLAVGNSSVDAMTAIIRQQAAQRPGTTIDPDLLEAFQYDLLRTLDDTDGPAQLDAAIHNAWFGAMPGGCVWQVVATPPDDPATAAQEQAEIDDGVADPSWLAGLNQQQATYDLAVRELASLRRQLYEMWWKRGRAAAMTTRPSGLTDSQFAAALDPTQPSSIAGQVVAKTAQVAAAQAAIPWGATQDDLTAAITAYTATHPLPPGTELKRADLPAFRAAADPVVVIAGAQANAFVDDLGTDANGLLGCRFVSQVVSGMSVPPPGTISQVATGAAATTSAQPAVTDAATTAVTQPTSGLGPTGPVQVTASMVAAQLPVLSITPAAAVPAALLTEFFFLDPVNAASVATAAASSRLSGTTTPQYLAAVTQRMATGQGVIGTAPAILPQPWAQPWAPLFLEWQVDYYPAPYGSGWQFDGADYAWSGSQGAPASTTPITLLGRSLLTPQPTFNFKARLDAYLATAPDDDVTALESFVTSVDGWDFLSQALSGFNAQLALRDPSALLAPDAATVVLAPTTTMATLVADGASAMPMANGALLNGAVTTPPAGFQPLRAGQFAFRRVSVVDRFGQSVDVVLPTTASTFTPITAEGLAPPASFPGRFVQLPPRLLQPARLAAGFVSPTDDTVVLPPDGPANPICAWIVPSHLDAALACYDPGGAALGDLALTAGTTGGPQVSWVPAPGSGYPDLGSLRSTLPRLADFLGGIATAGPAAFADLLATIDATLWTIDPPGTGDETYLSVLTGRPLALVRAAVRGELSGPALTDPTWPGTFAPPAAAVLGYTFPVRLGDAALHGDGLVGCLSANSGTFLASYLPQGLSTSYITAIGPGTFASVGFADAAPILLTLLVDPQAPVHLVSDVLPTTTLRVPQRAVTTALEAMATTVRLGPVLTDVLETSGTGQPSVLLPRPLDLNGTWSWAERAGSTALTYDVAPADAAARFPSTPAMLRTGRLQLTGALEPPPTTT
jgi:hypothetical protein